MFHFKLKYARLIKISVKTCFFLKLACAVVVWHPNMFSVAKKQSSITPKKKKKTKKKQCVKKKKDKDEL